MEASQSTAAGTRSLSAPTLALHPNKRSCLDPDAIKGPRATSVHPPALRVSALQPGQLADADLHCGQAAELHM